MFKILSHQWSANLKTQHDTIEHPLETLKLGKLAITSVCEDIDDWNSPTAGGNRVWQN